MLLAFCSVGSHIALGDYYGSRPYSTPFSLKVVDWLIIALGFPLTSLLKKSLLIWFVNGCLLSLIATGLFGFWQKNRLTHHSSGTPNGAP